MFWDVFCKECDKINKKPNKIAMELGLSGATTTKWKAGAIPNGETLVKIADYFGVSIDYLLGRTDEPSTIIGIGNVNGNNSVQNISPITNYNTPTETKDNEAINDPLTQKFLNTFINLDLDKQVEIMKFTLEQAKKGA